MNDLLRLFSANSIDAVRSGPLLGNYCWDTCRLTAIAVMPHSNGSEKNTKTVWSNTLMLEKVVGISMSNHCFDRYSASHCLLRSVCLIW